MSTRAAWIAGLGLAAVAACARAPEPPVAAPPPPPPAPVVRPPLAPPGWTYWGALDAGVIVGASAPEAPYLESQIALDDGAAERWSALAPNVRQAILSRGLAVVPRATATAHVGEAYAALAGAHVPYVVTMDALFWLTHVARDRALAAVEDAVLAPALAALVQRLDARLAVEARTAPGDLVEGYAIARAVIAVARALLSPSYAPPPELARLVSDEVRHIEVHAGPSRSALLGVTVDYSQIVPRGAAGESAARAAYARAISWLAGAPFAVGGKGEVPGAELDVGGARAHTRAALLLAHALDFEVDLESAYAWHRLESVAEFAGGAADDVSPRELADVAASFGMNVRDASAIVDTAKLDRVRHALLARRAPKLDDAYVVDGASAPIDDYLRAATSARLLPARSTPDAEVLQSLVFPRVGALDPRAYDPPPASARARLRAFPRALDVAAWLGAPDARAILHDENDDAYAGYDDALAQLGARRPPENERHGSLYSSSLDAIATYLAPSAADAVQPSATGAPWRKRKLEVALAAWTELRRDALAFARFPLASKPTAASDADPPAATVAFVEPHPETIATLAATVRQTSRGLRARAEMTHDSPAFALLGDIDELLTGALAIARREAGDEPFDDAERRLLASFPSRLHAIERAVHASRADETSLAVDVHNDPVADRALVEACGGLDDLYAIMREPKTGRLVLAVGVASTHYELSFPARDRPTDATWRARLQGTPAPVLDDFTSAYRVIPSN